MKAECGRKGKARSAAPRRQRGLFPFVLFFGQPHGHPASVNHRQQEVWRAEGHGFCGVAEGGKGLEDQGVRGRARGHRGFHTWPDLHFFAFLGFSVTAFFVFLPAVPTPACHAGESVFFPKPVEPPGCGHGCPRGEKEEGWRGASCTRAAKAWATKSGGAARFRAGAARQGMASGRCHQTAEGSGAGGRGVVGAWRGASVLAALWRGAAASALRSAGLVAGGSAPGLRSV